MRILHINCNYIGTTLHQIMIEHLDTLGVENSVFVPTYDKRVSVINVNENVTVSECFKREDRLIFDYKSRKIRKTINSFYDLSSFDMIHAYTLFTDGNVAYRLHQECGIPYVVAIRNTDVNDFLKYIPFLRPRALQIMKNASAIFFLSKAYYKEVFHNYVPKGLSTEFASKSYIIPNGIDDFWLENKYDSRDEYNNSRVVRIIYAGGIDKNKNIETTQKALNILNKQGIKSSFTVVGKIKNQKVYERIVSYPNTHYVTAQPKESLINYYREADIFVMPSYTETFGLAYAEAMSQGLPVIYTRGQGFDGQFDDATVGYSVNADDPQEVAEKIKAVISNYAIISGRCLSNTESFSWHGIVNKYLNIYNKVMGIT